MRTHRYYKSVGLGYKVPKEAVEGEHSCFLRGQTARSQLLRSSTLCVTARAGGSPHHYCCLS